MEWGGEWGGFWGGPDPVVEDHADIAVSRYPDCTRSYDRFVALTRVFADRWQRFDTFVSSVQPYALLDYDTANGVWLDLIGALLGVPRGTRDDDYYRTVLAAYAQVLYPRRRYVSGLLEALGALAGDVTQVKFTPSYPMGFVIEISGLTIGTQRVRDVADVTSLCTPTCYNPQLVVVADNPFLFGDATATVTVTTEGFADATGAVAGGGLLSAVVSV